MAYNISLTSGQDLVTVADGTVDTNYTSLTLIGKNFAGYGDFLNENLVHLLENFANTTEPPNAIEGQVWWDTTKKVLKVYNGTGFKSVSSTTAQTSSPENAVVGDLWWDTNTMQLKTLAGGTTWVTIGPAYTSIQGQTGIIADIIAETPNGTQHVIVKFMVNNVCVAVMSKDAAFQVNTLAGFNQPGWIKPGINFATGAGLNYAYYGNADNALNLGGVLASEYMNRSTDNITTGKFTVKTPSGLTVGSSTGEELKITNPANTVDFYSSISNNSMVFRVNVNNLPTTMLTMSPAGLLANTPDGSSDNKAVATKEYVVNSLTGASSIGLRRDGGNSINGVIVPDANNTRNFGSSSAAFASIYATNFVGTASNSLKLGGILASQYVRTDTPTTINAPIITTSDTGLTLGAAGDFKIYVTSSPNAVHLQSVTSGKSLNLAVNIAGGSLTQVLGFDGATGLGTVLGNPVAPLGIATKGYVDSAIGGASLNLTAISTDIIPATNVTYNVGSSTKQFSNVWATTFHGNATTANYADLAERFAADQTYLPGTVVEIGGTEEVTAVTADLSDAVFGVVSTDPAYLMNASAGTNETHPPIALHGRVPVRVIGKARKGDRLVSAGNGVARVGLRGELTAFNTIGRALENKTTEGEGTIVAIVKINS